MQKMKNLIVRILLIIAGTLSILIGIIGIFLPILPTTPLLLLGATCYMKSSKKLYNILINNKIFGKYIRNYIEERVISQKSKIIVLSLLWITMSFSMYYMTTTGMSMYAIIGAIIFLLIIAIVITIHVLSLNSLISESNSIVDDDMNEDLLKAISI